MHCFQIIVALCALFLVAAFWDDRDYHDDWDDDAEQLPDDWESRIDPDTMQTHLSNLDRRNVLGDDILFADAGIGSGAGNFSGARNLTLWKNAKVPYEINRAFGAQDRFIIEQAMRIIERKTFQCVTFKLREKETDYIEFKPGDNCSSCVGVCDGMQPIFLDRAQCMQLGTVQHEILHALGLYHEHSRSDRNSSVIVYDDEILDSHKANFRVIPQMPTFGTAYDLDSIMHYGPYDFARSINRPTMIPRADGANYRMGQRNGLSVRDVAKLRNAYKCQVEEREGRSEPLSFPGFSGEPMTQEQCGLQFGRHCYASQSTPANCSAMLSLEITCDDAVSISEVQQMTAAMAAPPLRYVQITVVEHVVTTDALSAVAQQTVALTAMRCYIRDPTAKLPLFSFTNLLLYHLMQCIDIRIKRSDFQFLPKLKAVLFTNVTILYLEEGTFTALPDLQILAWHKDLPRHFGVLSASNSSVDKDHDDQELGMARQAYLQRLHCDCELAWLRRWLQHNTKLRRSAAPYELFWLSDGLTNIKVSATDVYIPINCAVQPFPSDLTMINLTQTAFSINEPRCATNVHNRTYDSLKLRRTFSSAPLDPVQCLTQFSKTCRAVIVPYATMDAISVFLLTYCLNQKDLTGARQHLQINCCGNDTTIRELQDMTFAMARPPLRRVDLLLTDGDHIVYRAFAPIITQVFNMHLFDCKDQRPTAKLSQLGFGSLIQFTLTNCRDLVVRAADFVRVPNIRVMLFLSSTVSDITPSSFSSLPALRVLSVEYKLNYVLPDMGPHFRQYLHKLHCDCQFAPFRDWLQSQIIQSLEIWHDDVIYGDTNRTLQALCSSAVPQTGRVIVPLDLDERSHHVAGQYLCLDKAELYLPFDCSAIKDPDMPLPINFDQHNFSVNVPACNNSTMPRCALLDSDTANCFSGSEEEGKRGFTTALNQPIIKERRSELTAWAVDAAGHAYLYDDQDLQNDPVIHHRGYLPESRFWPNQGRNIPYIISEAFDYSDKAEIEDALQSIASYTSQCITFATRDKETDWIEFLPGQRCESKVGKQGGQQNIQLSPACIFRGGIQHLTLHALGFFHEHHRPDRNAYLQIYYNRTNLLPADVILRKLPRMPTYGVEYDLESILHYGAFDLTDRQQADLPAFLPKTGSQGKRVKMGQRRTLSAKDIVKLYTAYNCTANSDSLLEPVPNFIRSPMSAHVCETLAYAKCGEPLTVDCSTSKTIRLLCNASTSARDWQDTAATVARLPLHAVSLYLFDNMALYDAPDAFRLIRRQILLMHFIFCKDCYSTSVFSLLGFVNLAKLELELCYGLIIKKADFHGLNRLQILIFNTSTISSLELGTFTNLPALEVLSLESNIFDRSPRMFFNNDSRVAFGLRMDYLHQLHCSCRFAQFRQWRNNNRVLRQEVHRGGLHYLDGIMVNDEYTRKDLYYPVDCSAESFPITEAAVNIYQLEYSINEPQCNTDADDVTTEEACIIQIEGIGSIEKLVKCDGNCSYHLPTNISEFAPHIKHAIQAAAASNMHNATPIHHAMSPYAADYNLFPDRLSTPPLPRNDNDQTRLSPPTNPPHWLYGCIAALAGVGILFGMVYAARRRIFSCWQRHGRVRPLEHDHRAVSLFGNEQSPSHSLQSIALISHNHRDAQEGLESASNMSESTVMLAVEMSSDDTPEDCRSF
ncbi:uncharacterized protein LOC129593647 isoform X2 [Paramacrobiotus metropolitanus]|uniref:uncharacterized protein LOC129593647 isoform X2 n=1 Tax=Paramacrobiotus metropolitanus TaxID=2943436 RepID=UPI002445998E|nr:uncharacterized protein LOC129593647 isoform X2 [Paramacrobiotus metropolitanus]